MREQKRSENSTILADIVIVFSIVLSVFAALLLTQQEEALQTGADAGSMEWTDFAPPTHGPMTPTPTRYATDIQCTAVPSPIPTVTVVPAAGSTQTFGPMTPTPTPVPPSTTIGWSE